MGKSSQNTGTQTTNSQSENKIPDWAQAAGQTQLQDAYTVAQNMLGPYTGPTYAGITNGANADIAGLQSLPGMSQASNQLAQGTAANLTGYNAPQVNPGSIAGTNLSPYMNPYTQQVIGSGLQAIDAQRQQALNSDGDQARAQQAYGGSRQGVAEGATNAGAALQAGNLASQLQAQNFQQAQNAANTDIQTNLQGQTANQTAQQNAANTQLNASNYLNNFGTQGQTNQLTALQAALQGQQLSQANTQGQLNANQNAYSAAQQFPIQQLQLIMSALGQTPYGNSTQGTSTTQTAAPGSSAMSGIGSGLGILGALTSSSGGGSSILGTIGSGIMSALPAMSDRRMKTDIQKLGIHKESGLPLYAYRYKSDPKNYPKVVGPMADDIAKKYPNMVGKVAGKLAIHPDFMDSLNLGEFNKD